MAEAFGAMERGGWGQILWGLVGCDKTFGSYSHGKRKPGEGFKQGSKKGFINSFKQEFLYFTLKTEASRRDSALAPVNLSIHQPVPVPTYLPSRLCLDEQPLSPLKISPPRHLLLLSEASLSSKRLVQFLTS